MKKLYQSIENEAQNLSNTLNNYQQKLQVQFQGMLEKSEAKKYKIMEKLQTTKEQLQNSIENNNPAKIFKLQNKINKLEMDMQKINKKDQIANDYHLVYDGLLKQLQITQNQKIETISQAQRNENYLILCSIKRQAINLSKQVYKKKHIDNIKQICHHCNNLLNQYLKFGVDQKHQQVDILNIDIEEDQKFMEKKKFKESMMLLGLEKQQQYLDEKEIEKVQSKNDRKNKMEKKMQASQDYQEKRYRNQQYYDSRKQQYHDDNPIKQSQKQDDQKYMIQQQKYEIKQISGINVVQQQFQNLQIKDTNKESENIKKQQNLQETVTAIDDSKLCQICFEFPKEYVATPCGHFVYCHNCKDLALKECLICRAPVQLLIKVFQ